MIDSVPPISSRSEIAAATKERDKTGKSKIVKLEESRAKGKVRKMKYSAETAMVSQI